MKYVLKNVIYEVNVPDTTLSKPHEVNFYKRNINPKEKSKYHCILQVNIHKLRQPVNQYMLYLYKKYVM